MPIALPATPRVRSPTSTTRSSSSATTRSPGPSYATPRHSPGDAYALINRGFVLLKLAEFDRALADFDKVVSVYPRDARALYGRGYAKAKKGDAEGANLDMAVAKAIRPDVGHEFVKLDPTLATTGGRSS